MKEGYRMLNIREIDLFRDATYIEEIEEGYPKRKKYKVVTPTQKTIGKYVRTTKKLFLY